MVCATSKEAFELGEFLCKEYEKVRQKEQEMNKRHEESRQAKPKKDKDVDSASRTVTDIDYEKHEQTVKELERQEKEEAFLRKKQEASLWCKLDHEHGPQCRQPVHGCSHDHQKEWAIYEKSTEEKIRGADRFRQEGNEAFKKNNYGLAAVHYRKALLQFDYTFAEGDEETKWLEDVKLACLLNLAACKCQQEEWDEVLTQCRLALEINPRSVKAYYRTGQAHIARDKFEEAKDALMSAYEVEPDNPEVRALLRKLKTNMENYKVRQKEVYTAMTSGVDPVDEETAENRTAESQEPAEEIEGKSEEKAPEEAAAESPPADIAQAAANSSGSEAEAAAAPPLPNSQRREIDEASAAEPSGSGARRRRGDKENCKASHDVEDDMDEQDDPAALASEKKMLNCIFITAGILGAVSLSVVGCLMFMGDA